MGAPHLFSVFNELLNQKYFSEKILHALETFLGIETHPDSRIPRKK